MKVRLFVVACLLLPYTVSVAQELTFQDLLAGTKIPAKLKLADIPADFKAVKIKTAGAGGGGIFDMMGGSMFAMMGALGGGMSGQTSSPEQAQGMQLLSMIDLSWTSGAIARLAGKDYLVTYKAELSVQDMGGKAQPKLTEVKLTLVSTEAILSLTPEPDVTKDAYIKVLSAGPPANMGGGTAGGGGGAETAMAAPEELSAEAALTLSNVKQLSLGMLMYAADYDDMMPYVQDTNAAYFVTYPYLKNKEIVQSKNPNGGFLRLNMAISGIDMNALTNPSETPMYYDSEAWPDGSRIVAFADGNARVLTSSEWTGYAKYLKLKLPRKAKKPLPAHWGKEWEAIVGRL